MKKSIEYSLIIFLIVLFISVDVLLIFKYQRLKNDSLSNNEDKNEDKKEEVKEEVKPKPFITEYDIEGIEDDEIKNIFSKYKAMVASDSFGEGLAAYKVLNSENVVYARGRRVDNMSKDMSDIVNYNPKYLFLSYSANDLIRWNGNSEGFIEAYKKSISDIKQKLPNVVIIVNSVIPVTQKAYTNKPGLKYYNEFNDALKEMTKSMDLDFLENSRFLTGDDSYGADGIHPKRYYFYMWGKQMASYLITKESN